MSHGKNEEWCQLVFQESNSERIGGLLSEFNFIVFQMREKTGGVSPALLLKNMQALICRFSSSCCQRGNDIPSRSFYFIPVGVWQQFPYGGSLFSIIRQAQNALHLFEVADLMVLCEEKWCIVLHLRWCNILLCRFWRAVWLTGMKLWCQIWLPAVRVHLLQRSWMSRGNKVSPYILGSYYVYIYFLMLYGCFPFQQILNHKSSPRMLFHVPVNDWFLFLCDAVYPMEEFFISYQRSLFQAGSSVLLVESNHGMSVLPDGSGVSMNNDSFEKQLQVQSKVVIFSFGDAISFVQFLFADKLFILLIYIEFASLASISFWWLHLFLFGGWFFLHVN